MEIPFIKLYVWFAENNDAALLCQQLRGGQLFRAMKDNPELLPLKGEVIIPEDGRALAPAKHSEGQVVFADLAVLVENPRMYDRAIDTGVTFIVDLHFPLPVPEKMAALQPGRTDEDRDVLLDQEAREYWSKPERVSLAWEILRSADLVTVPHRDWLQMLVGTGVNGVLLPDVEDGNLDSAVGLSQAVLDSGLLSHAEVERHTRLVRTSSSADDAVAKDRRPEAAADVGYRVGCQ
jgi:hypothetical protein